MTLQQYLQQQYRPITVQTYSRQIRQYLGHYPAAAGAGYHDLLAYLGRLRERYRNIHTLKSQLSSIKAYYDYLCHTGQRTDHPARTIFLKDRASRDVQLQDLFTPEELSALLRTKERFMCYYYRNKVLISLLVYQGLRPQEIALLRVEDVHLEDATIYIPGTATTNPRTWPLYPDQVVLMYTYLHEGRARLLQQHCCDRLLIYGKGRAIQPGDIVKHMRRHYGVRYGGRRLSAGTIRASVIANLLAAGRDISEVQQLAGHKYPSSTQRYKQSQEAALQTAIAQYHPMQ